MVRAGSIAVVALTSFVCACQSPAREEIAAPGGIARVEGSELLTLAERYRVGGEALQSGDFGVAVWAFDEVLEISAGDELALYLLALARARAGDEVGALTALGELRDLGSDLVPAAARFGAVGSSEGFRDLVAEMRSSARRVAASSTWAELPGDELFPEGITYDGEDGVAYLGNLTDGRIVRVRPVPSGSPRAGTTAEDFVAPGEHGLQSVLGMKVVAERRELWAVATLDGRRGGGEAPNPLSGLLRFDLATGTLRDRFVLDDDATHFLNDLDLAADGSAYITDTANGALYRLAPGGSALEVFRPPGSFPGANGIAVDRERSTLYVASWDKGLAYVDLDSGETGSLSHPPGAPVRGLDGLYSYDGDLIAIQNAADQARLVRFELDATRRAVVASRILECGNPDFRVPTTGVVDDDRLIYIATSYLDALAPDNTVLPDVEVGPVRVLSLPLDELPSAPAKRSK